MKILLPWPPSANNYVRHSVRRGKLFHYRTQRAEKYREIVAASWASLKARGEKPFNPDERIAVSMKAIPPDRIRRDLDNVFKVIGDSLTAAGVWQDDSQIDYIEMVKDSPDPAKEGYVILSITSIPEA